MASVERFIVLRHARAGRKLSDRSKDFKRGLDREGLEVALRLPRTIETHVQTETVLSSPFRRCLQTVQPLADELDLQIIEDDRFTPGTPAESVREAFLDIPADSVVSTHGEVISQLFHERVKCGKGAFWVVERRDGALFPSHYVEAPTRGAKRSRR
jgi:8-oxo-dGTP diphosphatase